MITNEQLDMLKYVRDTAGRIDPGSAYPTALRAAIETLEKLPSSYEGIRVSPGMTLHDAEGWSFTAGINAFGRVETHLGDEVSGPVYVKRETALAVRIEAGLQYRKPNPGPQPNRVEHARWCSYMRSHGDPGVACDCGAVGSLITGVDERTLERFNSLPCDTSAVAPDATNFDTTDFPARDVANAADVTDLNTRVYAMTTPAPNNERKPIEITPQMRDLLRKALQAKLIAWDTELALQTIIEQAGNLLYSDGFGAFTDSIAAETDAPEDAFTMSDADADSILRELFEWEGGEPREQNDEFA